MKVYEASDFIFMLRSGIWSGGKIAGVGYISAIRKAEGGSGLAGLTGFHLGNGVMLERNRPGGSRSETEVTFSVYDPYTGNHNFFKATAICRENIVEMLLSTIRSRFGPRKHKSAPSRNRDRYRTTYIFLGNSLQPVTRRIR